MSSHASRRPRSPIARDRARPRAPFARASFVAMRCSSFAVASPVGARDTKSNASRVRRVRLGAMKRGVTSVNASIRTRDSIVTAPCDARAIECDVRRGQVRHARRHAGVDDEVERQSLRLI